MTKFPLASLTSSRLKVQGEGDGGQADGFASVATSPVPVQHVEVSVSGAHEQVLLEGLQTGASREEGHKGTIIIVTTIIVREAA